MLSRERLEEIVSETLRELEDERARRTVAEDDQADALVDQARERRGY